MFVQLAVFVSVCFDSYFAFSKFWGSFRVVACNIVREPFAMAWHICKFALYQPGEWSLKTERNLLFSQFLEEKKYFVNLRLPLKPMRYSQFCRKIKTKWRSFGGAKQICLHAVSWVHDWEMHSKLNKKFTECQSQAVVNSSDTKREEEEKTVTHTEASRLAFSLSQATHRPSGASFLVLDSQRGQIW